MRVLARLGAHGGAWMAVALLSTAAGTVAAGVAPMVERTDDEALRLMVERHAVPGPRPAVHPAGGRALTPIAAATALPDQLPAPLREVTEVVRVSSAPRWR